jgi:hypothetical protein
MIGGRRAVGAVGCATGPGCDGAQPSKGLRPPAIQLQLVGTAPLWRMANPHDSFPGFYGATKHNSTRQRY